MTMYLASEWVVNVEQLSQLRQLSDLVTLLGGKFLILPAVHPTTPTVDKLLIQISETEHNHFLQESEKLGFTSWLPIEASAFEDEFAFNPYRKSAYTQRTWEARVRMVQPQTAPQPKKPKQDVKLQSVQSRPTHETNARTSTPQSRKLNGDRLLGVRNFGEKSLDELVNKLKSKGYLSPDDEIDLRKN